jgi:hypothetical protein
METRQKIAKKFTCLLCDYKCCKKSDYIKHTLTSKHKNRIESNNLEHNVEKNRTFTCKFCDKKYNARNSLWYHEQKCNTNKNTSENDTININPPIFDNKDEVILMLIKENKEFRTMLLEQQNIIMKAIENGTHNKNAGNNNNNITNNSHNKTKFNLNLFLNETCKDAMNITDFVSSIKIQSQDLENVGHNGYVDGISNIIVKNLNALEVNKRPVHCSDLKREIMYVKDENKWEKEKEKLENAIKKVSYKNVLKILEWQKENPGCEYSHHKENDKYLHIVNESMGASTEEEKRENINKIITTIAKEVVIEKEAE